MEIVIASRNLGKIREFRTMLDGIDGLDIDSLLAYPEFPSPEETGETFEENATIKAAAAAEALNQIVLADDSGLVVPALRGEPGVRSARYAGDEATDWENNQKLLKALEGKEDLDRQAYYECVLVLASPDGVMKVTRGHCEGTIQTAERGRNGFGYDSVFAKHDYDKTFGELSDDVKNRISHRRKALDSMRAYIEALVTRLNQGCMKNLS